MPPQPEGRPQQNYRVLHTLVGPWEQGRVLSTQQIQGLSDGVDIERLIKLGAIEAVDQPVTREPVPPGPENLPVNNAVVPPGIPQPPHVLFPGSPHAEAAANPHNAADVVPLAPPELPPAPEAPPLAPPPSKNRSGR